MKIISKWKASYRLLKYGLHAPKIKPECLYQSYRADRLGLIGSNTLDLGCGSTPRNPFEANNFYGVDPFEQNDDKIKVADLAVNPIPFEKDTIDFITAHDLIEHIPRVIYSPSRSFPFINLMNEIFRCLKPGGYFFHIHQHILTPPYSEIPHTSIILPKRYSVFTLTG